MAGGKRWLKNHGKWEKPTKQEQEKTKGDHSPEGGEGGKVGEKEKPRGMCGQKSLIHNGRKKGKCTEGKNRKKKT